MGLAIVILRHCRGEVDLEHTDLQIRVYLTLHIEFLTLRVSLVIVYHKKLLTLNSYLLTLTSYFLPLTSYFLIVQERSERT